MDHRQPSRRMERIHLCPPRLTHQNQPPSPNSLTLNCNANENASKHTPAYCQHERTHHATPTPTTQTHSSNTATHHHRTETHRPRRTHHSRRMDHPRSTQLL